MVESTFLKKISVGRVKEVLEGGTLNAGRPVKRQLQ